ncbi:hypothetical protein CEXT_570431 [Caerostris extrusa]|uniref:Uncharacterized protein n=1 Tax=Caerostris extrusa TaxID=172846 RepID=A0AAV4PUY3_CAEEX|nr:hypothetical protein CEXT_570431 [Caerostris extrusa]
MHHSKFPDAGEAVIHFVSHNVMRSYSDAISSRACSQRDYPVPAEMATNIRINGRFHFKTDFSHLCPFRCLHSVDRSALCRMVSKWVRTVFMLQEMIFTANGWWY